MKKWLTLLLGHPVFIFICSESTKIQYVNYIQRTGQWDHDGTENCPKYVKNDKKHYRLRPDEKWTIHEWVSE